MGPTVSELWRYPFKSMVGERIGRTAITRQGVVGDRIWACRDEGRGGIRGAKQLADLMLLRARLGDGDVPEVELPDGSCFPADAPDAASRISAAIGEPVTVWSLQPADDLDHYRRGRTRWREALGLDDGDPAPDFSGAPRGTMDLLAEFETPPGSYVDAFPLLVLTRQSLDALARRAPDSIVDVRRFRPNVLVDAPGPDEFPELGWVGRRLRIGSAVVEVAMTCPRCVMISRPTDDLPPAREMQKVVVRQLDHTMGVYANVVEHGEVAEGDDVELLPRATAD